MGKSSQTRPTAEQIRQTNKRIIQLIIFAVIATGLLTLVILLVILIPRTPAQVSIISQVMAIALIMCPVVLCLLPIYFLFAIAGFYVGKLNGFTGSKLGKLQDVTQKAAETTIQYSETLSRRTIGIREKVAILNKIINDNEDESGRNSSGEKTDGQ